MKQPSHVHKRKIRVGEGSTNKQQEQRPNVLNICTYIILYEPISHEQEWFRIRMMGYRYGLIYYSDFERFRF